MKTMLVIGAHDVLGGLTAEMFGAEGANVLRGGMGVETAAGFRVVDLDRPKSIPASCGGVDLVVSRLQDPGCSGTQRYLLGNEGAS